MLDQFWHDCHLNITEQAAGIILCYLVAAEPGPCFRDVATALLDTGKRGVEIPVSRPISGNVRGDRSQGSQYRFLISLAARLLNPAILYERERSTGNKYVSGSLPTNRRVNPVKRGRREHRLKPLAGKQCILELSVHKFRVSGTLQVLPGQCHEVLAGFERCDAQAPGDKAAGQLAAPAPDLKHVITAPDPCDPTSLVDEFVGIGRTTTVVLCRDLIKDLAVTTCGSFWPPCHAPASVHDRCWSRPHVISPAGRRAPLPRRVRGRPPTLPLRCRARRL